MRLKYLKIVDTNLFKRVNVALIFTDNYKLCCLVSASSLCTATKVWYELCFDILPNFRMFIFFMVMSIVIVTLNIISATIHGFKINNRNAFVVSVTCINCNDILCGVYLATLAIKSTTLIVIFAFEDVFWRSALLCFSLFIIILWYSLSGQLLLVLLAILLYPRVPEQFKCFIFNKLWK